MKKFKWDSFLLARDSNKTGSMSFFHC